MRVCIIGAGAAGLCVARHLTAHSSTAVPVVYEKSDNVGGVWVYDESCQTDSSVYKNLVTNLPKEVMAFPDFPFPSELLSFMHSSAVLEYLNSYANAFELRKYIKLRLLQLNHEVIRVEKVNANGQFQSSFLVQSYNRLSNQVTSEHFDAVFVCNGHYNEPEMPELPGKEQFRGRILHSKNYRIPEPFEGKTVLCLGTGPSGVDIAVELSNYAKKVYVCYRSAPRYGGTAYGKLEMRPTVARCTQDGVILVDGTELKCDAIICCTGYHYSFPFFKDSNIGVTTTENRVRPLFQHLIHIDEPRLCFIGLPYVVVPFPLCDVQVRFCLALLFGQATLPLKEEMILWEEADVLKKKFPGKPINIRSGFVAPNSDPFDPQPGSGYLHKMGPEQWVYLAELAKMGGFETKIAPVVPKMYEHSGRMKNGRWDVYRNDQYRIIDAATFEYISC